MKNKVAPPFRQAEMDIMFGTGISREGWLIDVGVEQGFVRKAGAWYTYEGDQLGQGKENARAFLRDNPDLADELEKRIKEKLGIGAAGRRAGRGPAGRRAQRHLRPHRMTATRRRTRRTLGSGPDGPTPAAAPTTARARPRVGGAQHRAAQAHRRTAVPRPAGRRPGRPRRPRRRGRAAVLDRFTEVGLVDDAAFAEVWVRTRHAGRGLSRSALTRELRAKGVDDETVADAVEAIDDDAEAAAARALVARRLPAMRSLPAEVRMRRLVGQLARKGYSGGLAMRVVREALDADQPAS